MEKSVFLLYGKSIMHLWVGCTQKKEILVIVWKKLGTIFA